MPDDNDEGKKLGRGATVGLLVLAGVLSGLTCWIFRLDPLPTVGHWSRDTGWFLTFVLVYFFAAYFALDTLSRGRKK
jgi:hypothetical protein